MSPLTIERLREVLREQKASEEEKRYFADDRSPFSAAATTTTEPAALAATRRFFERHGLEVNDDDDGQAILTSLWDRPVPPDSFQCPVSEPHTTLVSLSSLPKSLREEAKKRKKKRTANAKGGDDDDSDDSDDDDPRDDVVVEVPRSFLFGDQSTNASANASAAAGDPHHRPLGGNLTTKLTEYTRGVSGQCRPFRPGGLGDETSANVDAESNAAYLTQEATERSMQPLRFGSEACWANGTLLTAPPGVDFKVGLSLEDITLAAGDEPRIESKIENEPAARSVLSRSNDDVPFEAPPVAAPAVRWERSFLDDDSLFGSSSSSESESEEDDDEEENGSEDEDGDDDDIEGSESEEEDMLPFADAADESPAVPEEPLKPEDIDDILAEISKVEENKDPFKKSAKLVQSNVGENPLTLAQRQVDDQTNSKRKQWADTRLLPIDDFYSYIPNPAMTYPFQLDTFQQQAVARLERSESVFVAAHTSAGKTVVAEYACALARQRSTRCIYTSPIKALSNQKFRDFSNKFGAKNVGLITGDMQINADDSTCLIMTTEILRSMLYRGADLIRDIEWVIFDEVHYVNDSERGVVWEEVIIMLPSYVNLIFLSATTPNTLEFSDWIGRTKRKPVHVIKTDYRPVPLSHFLWADNKLHKIMEGKGGFLDRGYMEASRAVQPKEAPGKTSKGKPSAPPAARRGGAKHLAWQAQGSKQNWVSLVRYLQREELMPTVVFSFSKKKCEEIANMLRSLDLNTAKERSAVTGFTLQTVARLSPMDASLPQVLTVCEMVKRGIGVHHGGLLPILKEMVELLFGSGLIKVLFATETFAMGVNMPARAVVFNSIRKHDGTQFRVLEPGEYTQMAGRAGRRGLDKVGTVIICCFAEPPPMPILRNMLTGSSTMLRSQFRLTYNMILNLLRVEEMSVESMIKRSFSEFATQRALTANDYPKLLARGRRTLEKLEEQFSNEAEQRVGADDLLVYFTVCSDLLNINRRLLTFISETQDGLSNSVLVPGRIILVAAARKYGLVHAPGMVLHCSLDPSSTPGATSTDRKLVCLILLPESYVAQTDDKATSIKEGSLGYVEVYKHRCYAIYEISLEQVLVVSSTKCKVETQLLYKANAPAQSAVDSRMTGFGRPSQGRMGSDNAFAFAGMKAREKKSDGDFGAPKKASTASSRDQAVEKAVKSLVQSEEEEASDGVPVLNLRDSAKRGDNVIEFRNMCGQAEDLIHQMRSCTSHRHPSIEKHYTLLERKRTLQERVEGLSHLLSNESLQLFPDFLQRKAVLRTLGYLDENETVCVKGRVACEVNTCEELIVTEMVFEGILNDLEPPEIVAALSALVYQQKSDDDDFDMEIPETLMECCNRMKTIAYNLGQLQKDCKLEVDPNEYCDNSLRFGLVHVVYEWALGVPFRDICALTLAQEGSIVRCITRLDELCREVRNCARVVGNPTLYRKLEAASVAIKRDIVFASSLYVS